MKYNYLYLLIDIAKLSNILDKTKENFNNIQTIFKLVYSVWLNSLNPFYQSYMVSLKKVNYT